MVDIYAEEGATAKSAVRLLGRAKAWTLAVRHRRRHDVTRQVVPRSVKLEEREIMFQMLITACSTGILAKLVAQRGNLRCVMVVDSSAQIQLFYDQRHNPDDDAAGKRLEKMVRTIGDATGVRLDRSSNFQQLPRSIDRSGRTMNDE